MESFYIALLIIFGVIVVACLVYYIYTLPARREKKEKLRRKFLLYEEQMRAETAKQNARIAGEIARKNIDNIVKTCNQK
ncbi:MAG: hypothetical protein K2H01_11285 [Ruminococcus sp.]|nr:hypothetical protein [Ruminococcus sp.]